MLVLGLSLQSGFQVFDLLQGSVVILPQILQGFVFPTDGILDSENKVLIDMRS